MEFVLFYLSRERDRKYLAFPYCPTIRQSEGQLLLLVYSGYPPISQTQQGHTEH